MTNDKKHSANCKDSNKTKQHIIRIIQMLRSATLIQLEELEVFIRNYLT